MKVSYGEGLAIHAGPGSCGGAREGGVEASTGERAGQVLSREKPLRGADALRRSGRQHRARRHRETRANPARSQTLCTSGTTMLGNREIPGLPMAAGELRSDADGTMGRVGKPKGVRR